MYSVCARMYLSTSEPLFAEKIPKYKAGGSGAFPDGQVCGEGACPGGLPLAHTPSHTRRMLGCAAPSAP